MRRGLLVAAAVALVAAGCGGQTAVTVYRPGQYQGKPDTRPWDNAQFGNERGAWEKAVRARIDGQNEYTRLGAK